MSTKVYGGLRVVDPALSVHDVVSELKRLAVPAFARKSHVVVAQQFARLVDERLPGELVPGFLAPNDPEAPAATIRGHVARRRRLVQREEAAERLGVPVEEVDERFSGLRPEDRCLFALEDRWRYEQEAMGSGYALNDPLRLQFSFAQAPDGRLLAVKYDLNGEYDEVVEESGLFEDYHYQDQSDKSADCSDEEWEKRRTDWDGVFDEDGTFGLALSWSLPETISRVWTELLIADPGARPVLDGLVDRDERTRRVLVQALLRASPPAVPDDGASFSGFMARHGAARRAVRDVLAEGSVEVPPVAPLPEMFCTFAELPAPYEVPQELMEALLGRMPAEGGAS